MWGSQKLSYLFTAKVNKAYMFPLVKHMLSLHHHPVITVFIPVIPNEQWAPLNDILEHWLQEQVPGPSALSQGICYKAQILSLCP